jgi:hypothetical protein
VINTATLKNRSVKDLAAMARKRKVLGWHAMRKDELVRTLARLARSQANGHNGHNGTSKSARAHAARNAVSANGNGSNGSHGTAGKKVRTPRLERRLQDAKARLAAAKDLSFQSVGEDRAPSRDRLVVMVRDPFWLHAYWELSRRSIQRAQVAMGQHWHAAGPILRVHQLTRNGTTSASRQAVRDIAIHGGVNTWYIDVQDPPRSYQLEIGYAAPGGRFYCLARSNIVTTPAVDATNAFDRNWAEVAKDCDRIYAMTTGSVEQEAHGDLKEVLEERLHRPVGETEAHLFAPEAAQQQLPFCVDTELIVHGVTHPNARVTLRGEPVRLRPDGSFAVRFNLPDRRHVLPLVASSGDGAQQRTIVLAVDRNTKVMEPIVREPGE